MFKKILTLSAISILIWSGQPLAAPLGDITTSHPAAKTKAGTTRKVSYIPPGNVTKSKPTLRDFATQAPGIDSDTLVFSAPPRETPAEGVKIYKPIADYLSRVIGKKIIYKHPGNWLSYQTEMLRGGYDLIFDGPHFNSWRIAKLRHNTLARISEAHIITVIVNKNNSRIKNIKQLVGRKVCGLNPSNLGMLALLDRFDNPMRQPMIIDRLSWRNVYEGVVIDKKCDAGILPLANLKKYDASRRFSRIVFKTKALPNQAFSAGPRISPDDQARIATALTSSGADAVTSELRTAYGTDSRLVPASKKEYAGIDVYLKDVWGYER